MKRRRSREDSTGTTANDTEENVIARRRGFTLFVLAAYLMVTAAAMVNAGATGVSVAIMATHASLLALMLWAGRSPTPVAKYVLDLMPLVVTPLLYAEIPLLILAVGSSYHDGVVQEWEHLLFRSQPAQTWAAAIPNQFVSEVLHAGYLAYYPLIFVPPLVAYFRGEQRAYWEVVLALTVTYVLCFALFVAWPVQGPRYLWQPSSVPCGPMRTLASRLLEVGSSRGAAFPSSHVAIGVVQAAMAVRCRRRWAPGLIFIAALIALGAVYGGFHYAIDVLAGSAVGFTVVALTTRAKYFAVQSALTSASPRA
jgi:membrane-associated phospholipid phosphatase